MNRKMSLPTKILASRLAAFLKSCAEQVATAGQSFVLALADVLSPGFISFIF